MKRTKHTKLRHRFSTDKRGFSIIDRKYMPPGYYKNRPCIANPYHAIEIGMYEGVRFIRSAPLT